MEIFIEKQLISVVYSLILGLIFGAAYDIIRIIHIICGIASYSGEEKFAKRGLLPSLIFFLLDLAYVTAVISVFSVFVYWTNYGDFRWYLLGGTVCGFVMYYFTLGRLVMYFSSAVVRFLRLVFHYAVAVPVGFVLRLVRSVLQWVYVHTFGKLADCIRELYRTWRDGRYAKQIGHDIKFTKKQ